MAQYRALQEERRIAANAQANITEGLIQGGMQNSEAYVKNAAGILTRGEESLLRQASLLYQRVTQVLRLCVKLRRALESWLGQEPYRAMEVQLLGPAPAPVAKVNNRFRHRLTLAGKNSKELRNLVAHLVRETQHDKENRGVSVFADMNPLD